MCVDIALTPLRHQLLGRAAWQASADRTHESFPKSSESVTNPCEIGSPGLESLAQLMVRYRFGEFELLPERYELRRGGAKVEIEPRALEMLAYLVADRTSSIQARPGNARSHGAAH